MGRKLVRKSKTHTEIEAEISEFCSGILKLLNEKLIPSASTEEEKVYYMTLKGDYIWYLAHIKDDEEIWKVREDAIDAYEVARVIAKETLDESHPAATQLRNSLQSAFGEITPNGNRWTRESLDKRIDIMERISGFYVPEVEAQRYQQVRKF